MNSILSIWLICFCLIRIANGQYDDYSGDGKHEIAEYENSSNGKQDSAASSAASERGGDSDASAASAAAESSGSHREEDSASPAAAASSGSDEEGKSFAASGAASSAFGEKHDSSHNGDSSATFSSAEAASGSLSLDKGHSPLIPTDDHLKTVEGKKDLAQLKDKKDDVDLKNKKTVAGKLVNVPSLDVSDILKSKGMDTVHKLINGKKDILSITNLGGVTGLGSVKDSVTSLAVADGIVPSLLSGVTSTLGKGCGCQSFKEKLLGNDFTSFFSSKLSDGTKDFLSHCNAEKLCCALNGHYKEFFCFFSCKIKLHPLLKGVKADGQSCMFTQGSPGICKFGLCIPRLDALKKKMKDKIKEKIKKEIVSLLI